LTDLNPWQCDYCGIPIDGDVGGRYCADCESKLGSNGLPPKQAGCIVHMYETYLTDETNRLYLQRCQKCGAKRSVQFATPDKQDDESRQDVKPSKKQKKQPKPKWRELDLD